MTAPLVAVDRVEMNDGVMRRERLVCGHHVTKLSTEGYAKRRRCSACAVERAAPHQISTK